MKFISRVFRVLFFPFVFPHLLSLKILKNFIWFVFRLVLIVSMIVLYGSFYNKVITDNLFAAKIANPKIMQTSYRVQAISEDKILKVINFGLSERNKLDMLFRHVGYRLGGVKGSDNRVINELNENALSIICAKDKKAMIPQIRMGLKNTAKVLEKINKMNLHNAHFESCIVDIYIIADGLSESNYYVALNKAFNRIFECLREVESKK